MPTNLFKPLSGNLGQQGVSLIELVVFLVVVGIASSALFSVYTNGLMRSVDPLIQVRAMELAQARLDDVLALKYDASTPTGGVPACGTTGVPACTNTPDADMNDVDDYHGVSDTPYPGFTRSVSVVTSNNEKLVTVNVAAPQSITIRLAAYRANF